MAMILFAILFNRRRNGFIARDLAAGKNSGIVLLVVVTVAMLTRVHANPQARGFLDAFRGYLSVRGLPVRADLLRFDIHTCSG
jgi:hypothetical protein